MNAREAYQLGQRLELSGNPDREHPHYYAAEAIDSFADHYATERAEELAGFINGKQSPAATEWLALMADRAHDPLLLQAWMKLALAGDAGGLLLAVAEFTNNAINSDTEEWIEEQITTGNWANL